MVTLRGYSLNVSPGNPVTRPDGSVHIVMPVSGSSGVTYSVIIGNHTALRANVYLNIDGASVGTFRLNAGQIWALDRPVNIPKLFTFFLAATAPPQAGIQPGNPLNGVITALFVPEKRFVVVQQPTVVSPQYESRLRRAQRLSGREGGTALSGVSGQRFKQAAPMIEDRSAAVAITVRLVGPGGSDIMPLPGKRPPFIFLTSSSSS